MAWKGHGQRALMTEPPSPQYVASTTLRVRYTKPYLTTEADVDDYLRTRLIAEILAGKRITVGGHG